MKKPTPYLNDLIERLRTESDLCRNETADDIARLLDEATNAILSLSHTTFHFEICPTHSAQSARFDGQLACCIQADAVVQHELALNLGKEIDRLSYENKRYKRALQRIAEFLPSEELRDNLRQHTARRDEREVQEKRWRLMIFLVLFLRGM